MLAIRLIPLLVLATATAALVAPTSALAATSYVDVDGAATSGCFTQSNPCGTIADGIAAAGAGGTVIVDDDTYREQLTLDGQTLRTESFDGVPSGGRAFIDGESAVGVTVIGDGATIESFHLRGDQRAVEVDAANVNLTNNVFDEGAANATSVYSHPGATGLTLTRNIFLDGSDHTDATKGAVVQGDTTLIDNTFERLNRGVEVTSGGVLRLTQNSFFDMREDPGGLAGISLLADVADLNVLATQNWFTDPTTANTTAIELSAAQDLAGTLRRNRIAGASLGLVLNDTANVDLDSNVITGNTEAGLRLADGAGSPSGEVRAVNTTLWDNALDIDNQGASLTLDSSIVERQIAAGADATCTIEFSRGPVTGGGCDDFQTSADPIFTGLDSSGDYQYYLSASSPLLDLGNPAAPNALSLDIQGQPRAVDASPGCTGGDVARRDIGADEFVPEAPDCSAPPTGQSPPTDTTDPETTIDRGPKAKVKSKGKKSKATFEFSASEAGASFECSLDGDAFEPCASGVTETIKAKKRFKRHEFRVRATDLTGNRDQSPAEHVWKVKRKRKRR